MDSDSNITLGRVTSVFTEKGKVYVSVQHDRPGVSDEKIIFASVGSGHVLTPQQGDLVELYEVQGGGTAARFAHSSPSFGMPDVGENEMVFKFDADTEITVMKNGSGGFDVNIDAENITFGDDAAAFPLVTDVDTTKSDGYVTSISLTKTTKVSGE